jgi:hypothetical protein
MTERAQKLKAIVKGTAPQATYGTNPMDPWSAKANMSEDATLNKYLMSRGINPKYATKDQKVAHSKTTAFNTWKNSRMLEDTLEEKVDKKDTVTLDIPLLIRVLELAREDIRTDMDLHRVVEKLINIRNKGMLTMKDYNYISKIHEEIMPQISENHVAIAMGKMLDDEGSMILNQLDDIDRCSKMIRDYVGKDYEKQMPAWVQSKVTLAADYINTVGSYLSTKNEEVESIDEISTTGYHKAAVKSRMDAAVKVASSMGQDKAAKTKLNARNAGLKRLSDRTSAEMKKANSGPQKPIPSTHDGNDRGYGKGRYMGDSVEHDESLIEAQSAAVRFQKALEAAKKKREEETARNAENAKRALTPKPVQEADCSCDDVPAEDKNKKLIQMSKSARIIKSIYKKQGVKEETYDHEKEDKSVATYGKKPKVVKNDPEASFGDNGPDAAAILSGGTTLTGQKRDVVEIDPMMRKRPGSDPKGKNKET